MNFKTQLFTFILAFSSLAWAQSPKATPSEELAQITNQYKFERLKNSLAKLDVVSLYELSLKVEKEQESFKDGTYAERLKGLSRKIKQELYARNTLVPEVGYERSGLGEEMKVREETLQMCYLKHPTFQHVLLVATDAEFEDVSKSQARTDALRTEYLKSARTFQFCFHAILDFSKENGSKKDFAYTVKRTREISRVLQSYQQQPYATNPKHQSRGITR